MASRKKKSKPLHESSGAGSTNAPFCSVMLTWCPAHKSPVSRGERVSPSRFHVQNDDRARIFSDGSCFGQRGIYCCQFHLDSLHFRALIKPRLLEECAGSHVCLCWHRPSPCPCKTSPQVWKEEQLWGHSSSSCLIWASRAQLVIICISSVRANGQHRELLVSSLTWECTLVSPLVLDNLGWWGSDCTGRSEPELQHLYRSPYNHKKSRTDNFALTCNVKYLINNLNNLQIPSLTDSIWIAFCKLSGFKFKHIRAL